MESDKTDKRITLRFTEVESQLITDSALEHGKQTNSIISFAEYVKRRALQQIQTDKQLKQDIEHLVEQEYAEKEQVEQEYVEQEYS